MERALSELNGVQSRDVNLDTKIVTVSFDEQVLNEGQIKDAIEEVGFDVA